MRDFDTRLDIAVVEEVEFLSDFAADVAGGGGGERDARGDVGADLGADAAEMDGGGQLLLVDAAVCKRGLEGDLEHAGGAHAVLCWGP